MAEPVGRPGHIRAALFLVGGTATASQILSIRELLVVFHGTELFLGVVLGAWLLLEAVGCYGSRRRAMATDDPLRAFAALQILLGVASLWSVLAPRAFRYVLHLPAGEALGLSHILLASIVVLAPVSLADGALFPLACRCLALADPRRDSAAHAYLFQALGACGAGALLVLWLLHVCTNLELAAGLLALNAAAAAICTALARRWHRRRILTTAVLAGAPILALLIASPALDRASARMLWHGHQLAKTANSAYANIAVIRHEEQLTVFSNGLPSATMPTPDLAVYDLAHFPLLFHPDPERILVIGPALGGLVREVAAHKVQRLVYAEHDPLVLEYFREFGAPLVAAEMRERALRIRQVEGRLLLLTEPDAYDVILVNLPMPSSLVLNRYFSADFFRLAQTRMRRQALLALPLPGSETVLPRELETVHQTLFTSLRHVFPHVRPLPGSPTLYLASHDPAVLHLDAAALTARLQARQIATPHLNQAYLRFRTDPVRLAGHRRMLEGARVPVNRDLAPWGVFASLLAVHRVMSPEAVPLLAALGSATARYALWGAMLVALALILVRGCANPSLTFGWAIASTGFAGMQMTIILIFLFQVVHANLYHSIGLLTGLFMLGAAVGALWLGRATRLRLLLLESAILTLLGSAALVVGWESAGRQGTIFLLMALSGLLTGAAFPVVSGLVAGAGPLGASRAALVYALDLLGAVWGALLTAALLVPVLGLGMTLQATLILKAASWLLCAFEYGREHRHPPGASVHAGPPAADCG
jgi:spermidine synthase